MEHTEDTLTMLHQIPSPAFFVDRNIITAVNGPAQQRLIQVGDCITDLLVTGQEEYTAFESGCLYLTMMVCGTACSASITSVGSHHLFVLEQDADQAELRTMALAAQALRMPLSNVMTVADHLFPLTSADAPSETQEQIARINRGLYQMLRIVCNMSDSYRFGNENAFHGEIRDIDALIQEHFDKVIPLLEHTGVKVRYTGLQQRLMTLVDTEQLERAISNILSNAVKFSGGQGVIDARLIRKGRMLYFTVTDSGCGLSSQVSANVFRRYQRSPGLEDIKFGLGLGMVLIRNAASSHGGTVLLEQGEDFGLRLTMSLPIRQNPDSMVRSPIMGIDYAGHRDHLLLEFADSLPANLYTPEEL